MALRHAIYQEIIARARERVLKASWRSDRPRMAAEEAHLEAIPRLLRCVDERRHRHYLRVERPRLVRACGPDTTAEFEPLWAELEQIATLQEASAPAPAEAPLARLAGPVTLDYAKPGRPKV